MISHSKSGFLKAWKDFQNIYVKMFLCFFSSFFDFVVFQDVSSHDETLSQSKEFEEAKQVHGDLEKAQQEDRA